MEDSIVLIDAFAQIFRCYYAVRSLSNRDGEPTNALFGMMRFLLKLEEKYPGAQGAFVFDSGRPPHRMALAPDYKANRPPTPEDLLAQLPKIDDLVAAFGWNIVREENTEADDLIASLSAHFKDSSVKIISADKDLAQLVCPRIEMIVPDPNGKGFTHRGESEVKAKFGVPPTQMLDYLAIVGDTADNFPGIAGVGPKTAAQLLEQFGSIENMLAHEGEIKRDSLREKIQASHALLEKNIGLVRLLVEPPAGVTWSENTVQRRTPNFADIRAIATANGFRSMFADIDALEKSLAGASQSGVLPLQQIADVNNNKEKKDAEPQNVQLELF